MKGFDEIALPDAWLVAGCIAQTIWNLARGQPAELGIKDVDLIYFDDQDGSLGAEAGHERRLRDFIWTPGDKARCQERGVTDPHLAGRNISSVAFDVGFNDLSYFNRAFRRHYAATPTEIRQSAMKADPPSGE